MALKPSSLKAVTACIPDKPWTTVLESIPRLSAPVTIEAGNASGKSSYANVTSKPSGKKLNIHTLFTPKGNGIDVVVPMESIRAISDRFVNTTYGFLGKRVIYNIVANYTILLGVLGGGFSSPTISIKVGAEGFSAWATRFDENKRKVIVSCAVTKQQGYRQRINMRALLIQHGCEAALEVLPVNMEAKAKAELKNKDHTAIILCLGNKDHLKRNCPKNNRKKSTGYVKKDDQPSSYGSIYDGFELMMVMSAEALLDWIMDSGGSYHMTPRLDLFFDFLEYDRVRVLLGDNMECKIRGTLKKEEYTIKLKSGKIKVINGSSVVLSGTQIDNCIYSLDGHAVARGYEFIFSGLNTRHLDSSKSRSREWLTECMNRTLIDMVHCLLIQSGLPKTLWAEATCTSAYLINRSPSTTFKKMKPMEKWSGHPSDYGMLRIFGCVVYSYVKQGELEPDGFFKEEEDLGVIRSSNWVNAGEMQMAVQDKGRD
uniref:Retrovirus-related Pol polyprotein from transposon TNT 1-94 n=1 Tax=Tanacetum cinerariifolium TaxID=118510 RepID=A0A6L2KS90_TANCI|nr:retrovirus-related Pol polyprotein from transposon TNT 1-94 [Tanacetum cinerariifolium]